MRLLSTKKLFQGTIIICAFIYFVLYFYAWNKGPIDDHYAQGVNEKLVEQRVDYNYAIIDKRCSSITNICYTILDKLIDAHGEVVERHMVVDGFNSDSDTVVRLIAPTGKTFENSDTKMWRVDHAKIQTQYVAALITAPFIFSTFSLVQQDNINKKILEIGLGGGSLDMFFHTINDKVNITALELDPVVVELSHKWFDVVENEYRRTIVADGVKYVQNLEKEKFDAVVLDACDLSTKMPCPSKNFFNDDMIKKLSEIVEDDGVFVLNMLSYNDNKTENSSKLFKQLLSKFGTCIRITLLNEINIIAACTHKIVVNSKANVDFLKRRAEAVVSKLELQGNLKTILFE